jgi:hypothetical protein
MERQRLLRRREMHKRCHMSLEKMVICVKVEAESWGRMILGEGDLEVEVARSSSCAHTGHRERGVGREREIHFFYKTKIYPRVPIKFVYSIKCVLCVCLTDFIMFNPTIIANS